MSLTITEELSANDTGTVVALATASEGKAAYSYDWAWGVQPQGVAFVEDDDQRIHLVTEDAEGGPKQGTIIVTAMDALGQEATDTLTLDFEVPLLAIELSDAVIEEELESTEQGVVSVVATGLNGVAPYSYAFTWLSRSSETLDLVETVDGTVVVETVGAIGEEELTGVIRATVTDAIAQTAYADINVTITLAPVELPELYLTSVGESPGWSGNANLPVADYDPDTDVILIHDGFMGFFDSNQIYDHDGLPPGLSDRTSTQFAYGTSTTIFGKRQPANDLTVYGYCALGIGTLLDLYETVGTGYTGGYDNGTSHMTNTHAVKNVYRGTDSARRVIGSRNSDLTGGPFTTVTVPGITVPNDNSIVIMCSLSYAGIGRWYQNGNDDDGWTHPAGQYHHKQLIWKLFSAGPTGNLSFTYKSGGAAQSVYKRLCFLVCLDSVVA